MAVKYWIDQNLILVDQKSKVAFTLAWVVLGSILSELSMPLIPQTSLLKIKHQYICYITSKYEVFAVLYHKKFKPKFRKTETQSERRSFRVRGSVHDMMWLSSLNSQIWSMLSIASASYGVTADYKINKVCKLSSDLIKWMNSVVANYFHRI